MRLTVLGSGSAFSACGCNAGYLVDSRVMVDCGAPVPLFLRRIGASLREVRLILLTHFHADHTFMLPVVLGALTFAEAPAPGGLVIAGPVGTREYVSRLVSDGLGRHIEGLIESRVRPEYAVLQDGSDTELGGYRIRAHAVVHSTGPSLAYQVGDAAGATCGFSGDSAPCAGLHRAIAGSDLFVCECTSWDAPTEGGHLWRDDVAGLIASHPATTFLLSHLAERRSLPGALIAHDLLSLEIDPAS